MENNFFSAEDSASELIKARLASSGMVVVVDSFVVLGGSVGGSKGDGSNCRPHNFRCHSTCSGSSRGGSSC